MVLFVLPLPRVLAQATELKNISPQELTIEPALGGSDFFPNGQTRKVKFGSPQALYAPPPFNDQTIRDVQWEIRVPKDDLSSPVKVEYQVLDASGEPGNLSNQENNSNSTLPVNVAAADEIQIIEEQCSSPDPQNPDSCKSEIVVVKGTAKLLFDVSQFRAAGKYNGSLSVCVRDKNDGCI